MSSFEMVEVVKNFLNQNFPEASAKIESDQKQVARQLSSQKGHEDNESAYINGKEATVPISHQRKASKCNTPRKAKKSKLMKNQATSVTKRRKISNGEQLKNKMRLKQATTDLAFSANLLVRENS